ncbi:MAG: hypothetical protein KGR24_05900 [Planctomycetes bacterium]|nr:hypothetical protein [Planctomycetota bacterium]
MPTYILGRDQVADAPGVLNDNVKRVSLKVAGSEQDVTVFKGTALTQLETMIGLVDITFEIVATATTATIGQTGTFVIGNVDGADLSADAVVTDVRMNVTPKGVKEFTISYAIKQQAD